MFEGFQEIALAHPFWRYFEIFRGEPYAFLLDSALPSANLGRFSFLGGRPRATLRAAGDGGFSALRKLIAAHATCFGAVGCVSYEGELRFMIPGVALAHDHETGKSWLAGVCPEIARFEPEPPRGFPPADEITSELDEPAYQRMVQAAREHIFAGNVFEVCTTRRLTARFDGDPWELYRELRRTNPAPFAAFLKLRETTVVSSSPERFLRVSPDGTVETRPIKGTRPRGRTSQEDLQLRSELAASDKDRAENMMIVDLSRNDLGRVCEIGSVEVVDLMAIESYATVHQMVSTVRGKLDPGRDAIDLLQACFPGGSMTGAPKIEAVKIIERLEASPRGVYSGCLGYVGASGAADFSIVIRTIVLEDGRASFGAGGAIVADSDPGEEWRETEHKAQAQLRVLSGQTKDTSAPAEPPAKLPGSDARRIVRRRPGLAKRVLILDNYDSFTFNLHQTIGALTGTPPIVKRNDAIALDEIEALSPERIVISPGPGRPELPEYFGVCGEVIRRSRVPILGVCLGHQGIAQAFGGKIIRARRVMHGKASIVEHDGRDPLYANVPRRFDAMRYHSLAVDPASLPACLEVTGRTDDGAIMSLRHRSRPIAGVQFHPESIGTPEGPEILANFLAATF